MRFGYVLNVVGVLTIAVGLTMLFPLGFSLYYGDHGTYPLLASMAVTLGAGALLFLFFRRESAQVMNHREGMAIVALGWFAAGVFGGLPFLFGGTFDLVTDAVFESISGFTTTGASVLTDIEAVPRGLLMWRSLTHWLGGMGIIVLSLAILPFLGVGGMQLYKAEVPGPTPDKLKPRIKDTAAVLWKVYLLLTVLQIILLLFGGMDLFDSICHTFGTMATGGFSTKNTSVAHYHSAYIDWVIIVFMFLAGCNFALHYQALKGRLNVFWKDAEFKFYLIVTVAFTAMATASVMGVNYKGFWDSLRYSAFQVVSIGTTTGFATADYELWPALPQVLLLLLMFLGGSAGSTGGGMKCMRILLLMKSAYNELYLLIHPRAIKQIKLGGKSVPREVMSGIWAFFMIYLGLFILSSILLAAMGVDLVTSFAAVAACIGNIGPGIGTVGPAENYAHLPLLAKWVLSLCMLLGRLEIYTVIVLFVPEFWRK
ncbi:MAG: TrkH family potassium uptake protein [Desulfovibrionaceae bacterium]|jgi:trk system potassium uptake protein TrkH|nr:TrkH family potassium uptake protein [Desulfovibrionaceae bacterium]